MERKCKAAVRAAQGKQQAGVGSNYKAFYLNKTQSLKEKVKERIARSEKEKAELQKEKLSLQNKLEEVSSELNNLKNLLGNSHQPPSCSNWNKHCCPVTC